LLRDKQDENTYCLTGESSRDVKRCLAKHVLWTLRYGDEVRDEAEYFKGIKGKPDPKEKKLFSSLIAEHTQDWSPSLATDPVQHALRSMIDAKQKRARRSTKKPEAAKSGNVIDLMAVLKKSLQGGLPQRN
jgi:DNA end-binding protein Ku